MPAPIEIIDALESVIDIFFSGVRHRERAAFILCDNLVELACKTKAKQHNYRFDTSCSFHDAWTAPGVQLPLRIIGVKIERYRIHRNDMQHGSAAATVDIQYCATAIMTAVEVIDRCWHNTANSQLPYWMKVALRVIRLYSEQGNVNLRVPFEDRMRELSWRRAERESVRPNAMQIEPGRRDFWGLALRTQPELIEECLNEVGVP